MSQISIDAMSAAAPGTASPGVALGAARRAQNLSVEDVARQLRLSVSQVKALEADAHDQLPGPVFVRGFIRNYARLLHMDADTLLKDAVASETARSQRVSIPLTRDRQFPPADRSRLPYYALAALALIAALAWYEFKSADDDETAAVPASASTATVNSAARVEPVAANPPASPVADPTALAASAERPLPAHLKLHFDEASWIDVRDRSGAVLLSQTLPAGSERTLSGDPPYSLIIGNARGVQLSYNDVSKDLAPHTVNNVARLTVE